MKEMNKKGVELSLQTIIIAIILLVVPVVVVFVFTRYMGQQGDIINGSISNVGNCVDPDDENCQLLDDLRQNSDPGFIIPPFFIPLKRTAKKEL